MKQDVGFVVVHLFVLSERENDRHRNREGRREKRGIKGGEEIGRTQRKREGKE